MSVFEEVRKVSFELGERGYEWRPRDPEQEERPLGCSLVGLLGCEVKL